MRSINMKKYSLLAALALFVAPAAFAELPDSPPPVGEPKAFNLPKIETYALRNGVAVSLVPFGSVPKVTIRANFMVGNINDGDSPWISDLTTDMMKEGAGGRDGAAIARAAASMGGDVNIGVGLDQGSVTMDVLSDSATDAVALIADILQRPTFPESEFERVRSNSVRNLSIAASQPGSIADNAFTAKMYPDHPYARAVLPSGEAVGAITLDDVKAFHAANFGAARTHIYVVGDFDKRKMKSAINKAFGKWSKGPAPLALVPGEGAAPEIVLIDRAGAVQSTLRLGKRVPALDASMDMEATDTMLGGYFSSRITKNIREDKGYTYSPNSSVSVEKGAAYWHQNADVTSEATGPALFEIMKEIRGLQDVPPTEEQLQGVKNYMNGIFVLQLASRGGVAGRLAFVNLHDLGADYLSKYVGRVQALSPADIQGAAKNQLALDEMSLVVVGDLASVRAQLEALPELADRLPPAE
jgi:predicted Zn-dependent peptidase